MEENRALDDKIAKDRLKTKRIKKKVYLKKLAGIPDREARKDNDEEEEYGDEQELSDS